MSGAFLEVYNLGYQLPPATVNLSAWARSLPRGASIRLDIPPPAQLWVAYFLDGRPVCSQLPLLGTDYAHVAISRKADYILTLRGIARPADAVGAYLRLNDGYVLYAGEPARARTLALHCAPVRPDLQRGRAYAVLVAIRGRKLWRSGTGAVAK